MERHLGELDTALEGVLDNMATAETQICARTPTGPDTEREHTGYVSVILSQMKSEITLSCQD